MPDEKGDKGLKEKVGRLLSAAEDLHEKQGAIYQEIRLLLGGGVGIGTVLKRLEAFYSKVWQVRYDAPYVWTYQQDVPQLKRLLKTLGVEEIERRMLAYVRHDDKYYVQRKHPFSLFIRNVNDYASDTPALGLSAPVVGCEHEPPCQSDQEHTKRRALDMRKRWAEA